MLPYQLSLIWFDISKLWFIRYDHKLLLKSLFDFDLFIRKNYDFGNGGNSFMLEMNNRNDYKIIDLKDRPLN